MRRLFLARHDADLDFLETGVFEPTVQIAFRETKPAVAVKLARFLEVVLEQIEDHDLPAGSQHFESRMDCVGRNRSVVQSLTEDDEINALRFDGWILQIAE